MAGDVAQQSSVGKYVPALAPVLLVAIGYMDPGNWASAIEGGSRFGFELLWVVIISNFMAALFQTLATRLGLVSGKHLAEICREDYPRPVCLLLWLLSELSIISLDLTMVAGTAIGLNLLLGVPILPSVLVLAFDGILVMLALPIVGVRRAELVAASVVGFVLVCFGLGTLFSPPSPTAMLSGLWPKVRGDSLYTAVGLIGANVVSHTFYLHSALLQRQHTLAGQSKDIMVQENMRDTIAAFGIALVANVAVLIVAASTFHNVGLVILTLQDAHALMEQILSSSIAPMVFGLALLCAGQLSSLTGTMTGKVTMEGFLEMSMEPWLHRSLVRGVAVLPAAFVAWHHGSEGLYRLLLFSQIIIAVELPFCAVPLIKASASEARMGSYRISSLVESVAWIAVAFVVVANIWLVFDLLLQEIDEFAGFAAHLETLLGTDSFGHYGEDTVNTSVFALVLVGIGLCVGFLVWLVVTPLRVDRIAMERKWVLEYELFERNERGNQEQLEASELETKSFDMIPMTDEILLSNNLVGLEYPPHPEPAERVELVPWSSSVSTSSDDVEEVSSEVLKLPNGLPPAEDDKPEPELPSEDVVLVAEPAELVVVSEPPPPPPEDVTIPEPEKPSVEEEKVVDEEVKKVEIASPEIDRGGHVLTEPEIAGTIATFLKDASFSVKEVEPVESVEPAKPVRHVSLAADDVESMALKKAEAEADADMMDKDEDYVDELEREDVLVGPLSHGNLGHSYGNIAYDGPSSTRSVGGRSDVSECNGGGSGSGSLSRLSGLGRAARRQFAAHLDEFWGKLFDLHGQSIASKTSSGLARTTSAAAAAAASYEPREYSSRLNSAAQEYFDYGVKRGVSKSTSSLQQQVIHMEAYARAHSNSNASTSAGFPVLHDSYHSGRAESLSTAPYLAERQYSSLRLPSYPEEFERQPATIHGYFAPSFLGRSAASSPTHKSTRPLDMTSASSSSIRALSGQAHAQQPLGIGVERDFESSQYGYQGSFEDTIRNLRSSQLSMNNRSSHNVSYKPSGGLHDRDLDGPRSLDSRMFERTTLDPLVYRATGELHMPSSGHSPIGRLGSVSGERAPLSFDEISPLSRRDGFSIQSEQNSLWSRPFEQLFGGGVADNNNSNSSGSRLRGTGSLGPPTRSSSGSIPNTRSLKNSDSYNNNSSAYTSTGTDADLETMENLRTCICKLLCLEGSEWLFRIDNGSDEDLIAAISAVEKMHLEGDAPDRVSRWQTHGRSVSSLAKVTNNNESRSRVCYCSDSCIWGKGLLVSFGVWCVHRVLELSLMESRPELWGKYTYVLNRLQGVLEPAFSKPRTVPAMCSCVLEAAGSESVSKQRGPGGGRGSSSSGLMKQRSNSFLNGGGGEMMHINTALNQVVSTYPYPWPWGRNTSSTKGRGASAAVFLEMIKEVEQAVGSRKGRTGTTAGDVAFPKGKENLASVLKRYKRRLGNKPPGAAVTTTAAAAAAAGSRRGSNNNNSNNNVNGYSPALLFAACL